MYKSPYTYSRKKKSPRWAKLLATIIALAVLGWGIRYLSNLWEKIESTQDNPSQVTWSTITSWWYVWKEVSLEGTLSGSTSPLDYSNTLITDWWEIFRINSSRVNLSNYDWFVYIQWVVSKFNGKEYTVDVTAIGNTEGALNTSSSSPTTETSYLPSIGLKIDTSTISDISYTLDGNTISFLTADDSGKITVEGFKCEAGFPEHDCNALRNAYTESSFVNRAGMTIAKQNWWNWWFAYNDAGAWYKITPSSDALLYKISSAIVPINKQYIQSMIPSIEKLCAPGSNTANPTIKQESLGSWLVTMPSCSARVTIDETEGEKVTILSQDEVAGSTTETPSNNTTTPTTPTTPTTETPDTNTTTQENTTAAPKPTDGVDFTSTRGNYTIHFPATNIAWEWVNVTENLWVDGLSCYVRIGIKLYGDRENADIGPAVQIYECTSKLSSESIKAATNGYIFNTSTDGTKLFLTKVLNPNWTEFANGITVQ